MLEALYEAERALPDLLMSAEGWSGLFADTERPHLKRVWRQWDQNRISLHDFGPCEPGQVFPHPHEWDSAIRIKDGECETGTAYVTFPGEPIDIFTRVILVPGSAYELIGPRAVHWVRPTHPNGYASVMVSGPPKYHQDRRRVNTPSRALTPAEIMAQLARFRGFYRR